MEVRSLLERRQKVAEVARIKTLGEEMMGRSVWRFRDRQTSGKVKGRRTCGRWRGLDEQGKWVMTVWARRVCSDFREVMKK